VIKRIAAVAPDSIEVANLHLDFAVIAIQGPNSLELLRATGFDSSIANLGYMSFARLQWEGVPVILCRTGYTGELGFEAVIPVENIGEKSASRLWKSLVENLASFDGAVAGLGARDTLRTEMGYPLHGQDLSLEINPLEASAGWAVGWKKPRFNGREALMAIKEQGVRRKSFALKVSDRGIPRRGMQVLREGKSIGFVTSGTFSPTLKTGIALALLDPTTKVGDNVEIEIRGRISSADVVKLPFVPSHVR
jgi:aminomethyltransferase